MEMSSVFSLFCVVLSLMRRVFHFIFYRGWQDHDKATSTFATTPLHCTLNDVLCPPTQ